MERAEISIVSPDLRPEAIRNLAYALAEASDKIESNPDAGLTAPRPYPSVAKPGRLWLHVRRYWIAYSTTIPPVILAVFFDTARACRQLSQISTETSWTAARKVFASLS